MLLFPQYVIQSESIPKPLGSKKGSGAKVGDYAKRFTAMNAKFLFTLSFYKRQSSQSFVLI